MPNKAVHDSELDKEIAGYIGDNIRDLMQYYHLTQAELAERVHVSPQTISAMRNGRISNIRISVLYSFSREFMLPLSTLITKNGVKKSRTKQGRDKVESSGLSPEQASYIHDLYTDCTDVPLGTYLPFALSFDDKVALARFHFLPSTLQSQALRFLMGLSERKPLSGRPGKHTLAVSEDS